ncbi:hypothetical protein [Parafrigoribacterium soli]|uniref:hypothetical protein n=1 Tax=Parafrigoribacterium soli TaxID=3144663 RepID=UPI0032F0157C
MIRLAAGLFGLGVFAVIGFVLSEEVGPPIKFLVVAATFIAGSLLAALLGRSESRGKQVARDHDEGSRQE